MSANSNVVLLITAENKASQILQQVQQQATQTQENINKANEKAIQTTEKLNVNALQAASSFAAVGAGVAGFVTSLDNLERAQLKVDIAQKRVNDLIARGKQGTEEYRIAQEKLRLAQDNLNDTYTNFIAGIGPQVFSTIFGLQGAFRALGITSVSQLIPAIMGVGHAMKLAFITNPIGIAILAITTVVGLLVFNVGGLRDKIVELGNQILTFLDKHLKPLADAIRFIIDLFKPLANIFGAVMPEAMGDMQNAVIELEGVTVPSFEKMQQETIELGNAIGTTMDQIDQDMEKTAQGVELTIQRNIENFGKMGRTAKDMAEDVTISMAATADLTEVQSSRIVLAGQAIAKTLEQIQSLQRSKEPFAELRTGRPRGGGVHISRGAQEEIREFNERIDSEIGRLSRLGQSLALAGGLSGLGAFGGGFTTGAGTFFGSGLFQALTPGGTLVSKLGGTRFDIGASRVIANAREVLERGFVTRADIIKAQHGFEGIFNRPTFLPLLVGEGGKIEHVKVTPSGRSESIVINQNFFGSVDRDVLEEANRSLVATLKARLRK